MNLFGNKYKNKTDSELMELLAKGKKEAFKEIYNRYEKKMLSFFYRMLGGDIEKSKDFLHDLFLKIIERPEMFGLSKKFSSWIYAVATNMCKNEYRRASIRQNADIKHGLNNETIYQNDNYDARLFRNSLEKELANLDEKHRIVFILRFIEEKSVNEIAEILECPAGTIKSRIHYTLKHLSSKLKIFENNLINN